MKSIQQFFSVIILAGILSSCSFSEEIDLSTEQKGQYKIDVDMSQAMEMMKSMGGSELKKDSTLSEPKDSSFSLYSQIDSVREHFTDRELSYFYKGTGNIKMNEKENLMKIHFMYPITDLADLKHFFETTQLKDSLTKKVTDTTAVSSDGTEMSPMNQNNPADFTKMLSPKSAYIITDSSISREEMSKEGIDGQVGDMKGMEMFYGQMMISTTIKLPRPAILVQGENAKLLDDKKTVIISSSILELVSNKGGSKFYIKF